MPTTVVLTGGTLVTPGAPTLAAGDLLDDDGQVEYDGLRWGADGYEIQNAWGLDDLPDLRTSDVPRPRDHGRFPGGDYSDGRTPGFQIIVHADTPGELRTKLDALRLVTSPRQTEAPLVFQLPGLDPLRIYCRPRRRAIPSGRGLFVGHAEAAIEFAASDPRIYDNAEQTASVGIEAGSGGLEFPLEFPIVFGTAGTSNTIDAVNAGTFESRPLARIDGPATNPSIENLTTGQLLRFTGDIPAGDYLAVDFAERTVLLNGTASRYSWVNDPDQWWTLVPGTNEVRFSAASSAGGALLTLTWRSAWL